MKVKVFLVDYCDYELVSIANIRALPAHLRLLPQQGVLVRMAGECYLSHLYRYTYRGVLSVVNVRVKVKVRVRVRVNVRVRVRVRVRVNVRLGLRIG